MKDSCVTFWAHLENESYKYSMKVRFPMNGGMGPVK